MYIYIYIYIYIIMDIYQNFIGLTKYERCSDIKHGHACAINNIHNYGDKRSSAAFAVDNGPFLYFVVRG